MNCFNCGCILEKIITDIPFKVTHSNIVIVKKMPVLQCNNCNEYLLEDSVMEKIDNILEKLDKRTELEILSYA